MNKIPTRLRRSLTVGLAAILIAAVPGVALAQTDEDPAPRDAGVTDRPLDDRPDRDRDLDEVKERILEAIEKRIEALERLSEGVAENEHVSPSHAAHLQNEYREATRILEGAADDVEDAESFEELREIVPAVFADTLVRALLVPKTHLVVGSDTLVDLADRFGDFGDTLQMVIDRLSDQGYDMDAAQAALDEMLRLIGNAADTAEPVADDVIGLDQSDWPDPAQDILEQGRDDLREARELLREARGQLRDVITAIREALSG